MAAFQQPVEVSRGLVRGDIDNDGDIDLLVTNAGGPARLYRNDFAKRGNWLQIHVVDPSLRRDSIGARVMVQAGGRQFEREVSSASSYLCSHDLRVHFGLGNAPQCLKESIECNKDLGNALRSLKMQIAESTAMRNGA